MMFAAMLVLLGHLPSPVLENEPSVVPGLLNPGRVKQLSPTPGGQWAFERPRDAADIGRDEATRTLSLGLPVGRQFCELRLTSMVLPQGTAGSLASAFVQNSRHSLGRGFSPHAKLGRACFAMVQLFN